MPRSPRYSPWSDVSNASHVDLEQAALLAQLEESPSDFAGAKDVYTLGGGNLPFSLSGLSAGATNFATLSHVELYISRASWGNIGTDARNVAPVSM